MVNLKFIHGSKAWGITLKENILRLQENISLLLFYSVGPTTMDVVVSVLVVVCKRMQRLPTTLGSEVYRGKDTNHKTLETTPKTLEKLFKTI